jgi:predicted RNA-binding Zn-ribbon protein involved in translation (DUF1610 family)
MSSSTPQSAKCPRCGAPMSAGSAILLAKSGLRGGKLFWMDDLGDESRRPETLIEYGLLYQFRVNPSWGGAGIRFPAWRCEMCRMVAFAYPERETR